MINSFSHIKKDLSIKDLGFSILNAFLILLACYISDNWSFSILGGPSVGQRIEQVKEYLGLTSEEKTDEFFFVNIAYDKELVPVFDELGFPKGVIDITHRKHLVDFLSKLEDNHKYVILDVLISNKYTSPYDSMLIETILNLDRVVIAHSEQTILTDERLLDKSGYSDYSTDIMETNFVKYEFLKKDSNTIAYKPYIDLFPKEKINKFWFLYLKNGHLQWKSLTLRFPIKLWYSEQNYNNGLENSFNENIIYNLGSEILDLEMDISSLVKDKIVVIGDFTEDDIHDTYIGKIAGPVINTNAIKALLNNELEIPWWLIIFLFVFYIVISYIVIRNLQLFHILKILKLDKPFIQTLISFIGFSAFFGFVAGIIYISSGKDINVLIPAVWFTFLRWLINTKWKRKRISL